MANMRRASPANRPVLVVRLWPHVVRAMAGNRETADRRAHPSVVRSRATSTVAGGDSRPRSPGWKGTAVSFSAAIWRIVAGRVYHAARLRHRLHDRRLVEHASSAARHPVGEPAAVDAARRDWPRATFEAVLSGDLR